MISYIRLLPEMHVCPTAGLTQKILSNQFRSV
jgi:hypothetical protein